MKTIRVADSYNKSIDERVTDFIKDKNILKIIVENSDNINHSYVIFYKEKGE